MIKRFLFKFSHFFVAEGQESQKHKTRVEKIPWTVAERTAVLTWFENSIRKGVVPGKAPCSECLLANPVLKRRNWKVIKDYVRNTIAKAKRLGGK